MTLERVLRKGQVSLNGERYRLDGKIEPVPQQFPQKRVEGDYTRASNPTLSSVSWGDFRGGMLLDIMEGNQTDRAWEADAYIRKRRGTTLPPLENNPGTATPGSAGQITAIEFFRGDIYVYDESDIYKYTVLTDTWSVSLHSLSANAKEFKKVTISGTTYLVLAYTTGYSYSSDGSSWTDDTADARHVTGWDDRLWGISSAGLFWYAFVPGTEVFVASAPPPTITSAVNALFVGPDAANEPIIYVTTSDGLFAYDVSNDRWVKTNVEWAITASFGAGAIAWQGRIYLPVGQSILQYDPVVGTIIDIGLTLDDGVSPDFINSGVAILAASQHELFAGTKLGQIVDTQSHAIYAWDTKGWYRVFVVGTFTNQINGLVVSGMTLANVSQPTTLWMAKNTSKEISYFTMPASFDPKQDSGYIYAAAGTLKTPWFTADQVDVDKLAVRIKVETRDTSKTGTVESIKVEYAIDYIEGASDASYTTMTNVAFTDGLINTDAAGVTTTVFAFPSTNPFPSPLPPPVGVGFKAIRFKVSFARGATTTNSPVLISLTLEHRKKLERKEGYRFVVNISKTHLDRSPKQQRADIQTILESNTLVEFTFREDSGDTRNFYVDIQMAGGEENTGLNETGKIALVCQEV